MIYLAQFSGFKGKQAAADARNKQYVNDWKTIYQEWEKRATDLSLQRQLIRDIAAGEQYVIDELEAAYAEHPEVQGLYAARVINEATFKRYFGKYKGTKKDLKLLEICREKALQVMLARNGKLLLSWAMNGIPMYGDATSSESMKALDNQINWLYYIDSQLKAHSDIREPLRFVLYRKDSSGYHMVSGPEEARYSRGNFYWKPEIAPGVKL